MKQVASPGSAQYWMLGAGALGRPRGMVWGGRREEGSGWGTCVYLWRIHFDIWQNQYNIIMYEMSCRQVRCTILDAWGWCTGMTQRDDMGREEGGGFRMGNMCIPVADSC